MLRPRDPACAWVLALGALAGLAASSATAHAAQDGAKAKAAYSDERLRQAWSYLLPAEQEDAAAYLRDATSNLETFQQGLIEFALGLDRRDLSQYPEAPPIPFYAPEVHAPGQPIPRERLDPEDPRAVKQRETMFAIVPKTGLVSAWRYDWGAREVQRCGDDRDATRLFFNALAGYPPDLDIGQALIERALDDGAEQKALAAFAHAYTDRGGTVFPGLTLYDAFSSATDMEMPDVDVLGVIHELTGDWKTWVAPVPEHKHKALYAKVFSHFEPAKRQRGLRTALAMTFFSGSIPLRDGYLGHRDRLHSWWDEHASTPEELAKELPKTADWAKFLERWSARIDKSRELTARGQVRRATLDGDAQRVRNTAIAILQEFGAFERAQRPEPPPPKPEPGKDRK